MSTDPRFPNRPDHPDFWLISQALIDTDAQADTHQETADIIGRYVDLASLTYMAEQRAQLMAGSSKLPPLMRVALAATWMDAFIAGVKFQHLKTSGAQEVKESDE